MTQQVFDVATVIWKLLGQKRMMRHYPPEGLNDSCPDMATLPHFISYLILVKFKEMSFLQRYKESNIFLESFAMYHIFQLL